MQLTEQSIILASSSPRRIEMMKKKNIDPIIMSPQVDETIPAGMTMEQAVMYLALKKALYTEKAWLKDKQSNNSKKECSAEAPLILAADTVVYKNGIIGKPENYEDALNILQRLRNTDHFVATGVAAVYAGSAKRKIFCEVTRVFFTNYSDQEIFDYINTDEPWDKAGAYAIQGTWGKYISHYIGDYDNVIGFPWTRISTEITNY